MKRIILVLLGIFILSGFSYASPKEIIEKVSSTKEWIITGEYNGQNVYIKDNIALVYEIHWDNGEKLGYGIKLLNMETKERLLYEIEIYSQTQTVWHKIINNRFTEWENFKSVEPILDWYVEIKE